jgi:hypothetical protein
LNDVEELKKPPKTAYSIANIFLSKEEADKEIEKMNSNKEEKNDESENKDEEKEIEKKKGQNEETVLDDLENTDKSTDKKTETKTLNKLVENVLIKPKISNSSKNITETKQAIKNDKTKESESEISEESANEEELTKPNEPKAMLKIQEPDSKPSKTAEIPKKSTSSKKNKIISNKDSTDATDEDETIEELSNELSMKKEEDTENDDNDEIEVYYIALSYRQNLLI